jgi:hypothetical protein
MRRQSGRLWVGLLLVGMGVIPAGGWGQAGAAQALTADEIVTRMMQRDRERQVALDRYGSMRTYHMEYHGPIGERKADMVVRMQFSAPDKKEFVVVSESGSTIFCKQILRRLMEGEREGALEQNRQRSMLSPENDKLTLVGREQVDGVDAWVLDVTPRRENRFNYKGRVWVSVEDYAVVRIVGSPAQSPTFLMGNAEFDYKYGRDGQFWLPRRNETVSKLRIGGQIRLTVDYGTYEIVARPGGAATEAMLGSR